jgi:hypothetical protein
MILDHLISHFLVQFIKFRYQKGGGGGGGGGCGMVVSQNINWKCENQLITQIVCKTNFQGKVVFQ